MKTKVCAVAAFLEAVRGDWRNAIYIECERCLYDKNEPCRGYLLAFNRDAIPLIIQAGSISQSIGTNIDADECIAKLSHRSFDTVYARWLVWATDSSRSCSLLSLANKKFTL